MIRYSLRTDIEIKNATLFNSNGSINLADYLDKMASLTLLQNNAYTKKELLSLLGQKLFKLLEQKACFRAHIIYRSVELFTINPTTKPIKFKINKVNKPSFQLSSFAYLRFLNNNCLLECPKSYFFLSIAENNLTSLCSFLAEKRTYIELIHYAKKISLSKSKLDLFLLSLIYMQALVDELEKNKLMFWEFQDLLFHAKSRKDRHANGIIKPFRHRELAPESLKKSHYGDKIFLENYPTKTKDFFEIVQARRSKRMLSQKVDFKTFSNFLYYSLKVQSYREDSLGGISFRASASAGALHGLENYVVVNKCTQLKKGLYYYNPFEHCLETIKIKPNDCIALLESAKRMAAALDYPAIYILTTSRFKRYQYKYASLAYSVMLKDLGCQAQTMNLVASALGLNSVILGDTAIEPLATILDLNYFSEGAVGSFALGGQ